MKKRAITFTVIYFIALAVCFMLGWWGLFFILPLGYLVLVYSFMDPPE